MHEMVRAIRAIWACWQEGKPLDFRGQFYTHTLMTPIFVPGPQSSRPAADLPCRGRAADDRGGGRGGRRTARASLQHRAFRGQRCAAALDRGLANAGRTRADCDVSAQFIVATGLDREERERNLALARGQVAFYASTPAYKPVLDCHGWGDLQPRLNALSKEGKWAEMGGAAQRRTGQRGGHPRLA
jgi:alkanesulfonate monooxygenase SsuD/methylene tetrahydromethanopterin reductase-like flavin-dependent oxidoreductase (luciferase family)